VQSQAKDRSRRVDFDQKPGEKSTARCCMLNLLKKGKSARSRERARIHSLELTFLGTRGEIKVHSRLHRRHSALLIRRKDARIMIDCGADWLGRLRAIAPTAIVLTHAHRDQVGGLADGAPCPVYATRRTLELLRNFPIRDRREIPPQMPIVIDGVAFTAHPVEHSIRAPAVGYRIGAGRSVFFYVPDIASLPDAAAALHGIGIYIGDGATLRPSMVRRRARESIGHAPIVAQLDWCANAGVKRAIFTHCGSAIVRGDARQLNALLDRLGRERGIKVQLASDGDRLILSRRGRLGFFRLI
jgi:phosphoribosyl 1,2-cyclic phosphodiesterase